MADPPAQPNLAPLSDGTSFVEIPNGTDPKDVSALVNKGEAALADKYGKQAAAQNSPVTTAGHVYSATNVYPNTALGSTMAWLDHNVPGALWAERNIANPIETATTPTLGEGGVGATANRIVVNRGVGAFDLPATALNIMKHKLAPERGTEGDIPYLSSALLDQEGNPQLGPDASLTRQLTEAALTGAAPGGGGWPGLWQSVKNAALSTSGAVGSDIGGKYFGEPGAFLTSLLFGGAVPIKNPGAKVIAHGAADESAPDTWQAWMNSRPTQPGENFQPLTSAPPPGMPDYSSALPGFKTLANETGQRVAASLSGVPYVGAPLAKGEKTTSDFIQHGIQAAAADTAGPRGLPPEGVNAGTLGTTLTEGAQQAVLRIVADQEARQSAQRNLMSAPGGPPGSAEVPVGNTYATIGNETGGRSDTTRTAGQIRADEIANSSPGGPNYSKGPQGFPRPNVPLPAQPSLTWDHISEMVTQLNDSLGKSGRQPLPGDVAAAIKDAANADREAAANAISPGAGAQFRENNVVYAKAQAALEQLRKMAGEELGSSGQFKEVPTQQTAAAYLKSRMQSPDSLDQTLLHPAYPADARLNAAAQIIATLGNTETAGTSGGFRPEAFVNQYGSGKVGQRPTIDALLTGGQGGGQPAGATSLLDNLRTVAEHFGPATSRFGLIKSLGSAELVRKILESSGKMVEHYLAWKPAQYLLGPQIGRGMSSMLESEPVKRAMANQPLDWSTMANRLSVAGAVNNANQLNRLHAGRVGMGAPIP